MSEKLPRILLAVGIVAILAVVLTYFSFRSMPFAEKHRPITYYGGDFTLQDVHGDVHLSDYKGKVVIAYFGFLNCTEACPQAMGVVNAALDRLTAEEVKHVQVLFISVDPERDNVQALQEFTDFYGGYVKGLTGDKATIDKLSRQYGVFYELIDLEGSGLTYTIDHSSRFYMIDKNGTLLTTLSHSTKPIELAAKIRTML